MPSPDPDHSVRSALFVPGDRPERIEKAMQAGADLVIIDLEDAVLPENKSLARNFVSEFLATNTGQGPVAVRINQIDSGHYDEDIGSLVQSPPSAVMLPKFESPNALELLNTHLSSIESDRGLAANAIRVIPLVESAVAMEGIPGILHTPAASRVWCMAFGAADYALDLGIDMDNNTEGMLYPHTRLPVASRAAGLSAPLDAPYMTDLKDAQGLREACQRARRMGFQGKLCVHPAQVETCNVEFSVSPTEVEKARKIVETYRLSQSEGRGVVQLDGKLIDQPIVERAMRILEMAGER
jgi:citrate lyase subunit beta/citryl-CoA lyase